jgi:Tfp pilus assembly protein PilN
MNHVAAIPPINLLPAARRLALSRRRRMRGWTMILVVYGVAMASVWAWWTLGRSAPSNGQSTATQLAASTRDIEEHKAEQAAVSKDIAAARNKLDGAKAVGHHADWSVLLDHLAQAGAPPNPIVVFERVDLHPRPASAAAKDTKLKATGPADDVPDPLGYALSLEGLANSQLDVFGYAKSLQGLQLFESVSIDWTRPRDSVAPDAPGLHLVSFQISCTLTDAAAAAHAPAPAPQRPTSAPKGASSAAVPEESP